MQGKHCPLCAIAPAPAGRHFPKYSCSLLGLISHLNLKICSERTYLVILVSSQVLVIYLEQSLGICHFPEFRFCLSCGCEPCPTHLKKSTSLGTKHAPRLLVEVLCMWKEWLLPGKVFLLFYLLSRCCSDSRSRTGSQYGYSKSRPTEGKSPYGDLFVVQSGPFSVPVDFGLSRPFLWQDLLRKVPGSSQILDRVNLLCSSQSSSL